MRKFKIQTSKDCEIAVSEFKSSTTSKRTVIIASATGVLQGYYFSFAECLGRNNINVYTFDYSGIGESLLTSIKQVNTSATNWGKVDLEAVINNCKTQNPDHSISIIGHSIGGQLIGLAPSSIEADKIILVAAQSGYWKFWRGFERIKMLRNWYLLFPIITRLFGYFPSQKFSTMKNLPSGVALEWSKWCRSENYLFDHVAKSAQRHHQTTTTIKSYSVSDDKLAPEKAVDWMTKKYENASIERIHLSPKELGQARVGHFGFFKEKLEKTFWQLIINQL